MTHAQLAEFGYDVSPASFERLESFARALLDENTRLNLTACRNADELWAAHVCDALALLPHLDQRPLRLLDLGAGGGLPGIPIACVREEIEVVLLDATRKKVDALRRITERIGVANAHAVWGRAEALAHEREYRETFDIVTARAVAPTPTLLELTAGFPRIGGDCWLFKSVQAAPRETASAAPAAKRLGMRFCAIEEYNLPDGAGARCLVHYTKVAGLDRDLPRPSQALAAGPIA